MAVSMETMLGKLLDLLLQGVQMLLVLAVAPLVLGVTSKVKARLLRRVGPGVLQPYRDLWKLLHKEAVLAHNASWLYRVAPYLMFALTWVAAALVPRFGGIQARAPGEWMETHPLLIVDRLRTAGAIAIAVGLLLTLLGGLVAVFTVFILVLLARPDGLAGASQRRRV